MAHPAHRPSRPGPLRAWAIRCGLAWLALVWLGAAAPAQPLTLDPQAALFATRAPLLAPAAPAQTATPRAALLPVAPETKADAGASLFSDRAARSFFAPWPEREGAAPGAGPRRATGQAARLLDLIARAEATPAGYDTVQLGARIRPPKPPTRMTLAEIHVWIRATPGQPHAIGRYQFIPPTLRRLQKQAGVPMEARFSPQVQDALAEILLEEAGLSRMRAGQLTRRAFMNNLAKIWAGLPNSSGRSHYHGYAGNKAVITWAQFDAAMERIFPG